MEFIHLLQLVIYHILYLTFCTLVSITMINFLSGGVSYAVQVEISKNHCFRSIHSWKKEMHRILI